MTRTPLAATPLWPLFLVSAAAIGFEIALTRYFAVATWSEYGYWVISIVMVGFALSGVVMALWRDAAVRHGRGLLAALPSALIAAAAGGFLLATANKFNPLQLQNEATWLPQIGNIALYYASLLPFFFLTGLYISLSFVLNETRVPRVYGFDLTGAGAGAALVLVLMLVVHPFQLVPALLPLLALAGFAVQGGNSAARWRAGLAALVVLAGAEGLLAADNQAAFNQFKAIYAPLHVPDARVVAQLPTPRGLYMLLDDFTERVDTDLSNDSGQLGVTAPPRAFGLYRDGNRIAALPMAAGARADYAAATLDAAPYALLSAPRVLLAGGSGGFRAALARKLGAAAVEVLETEPVLRAALAGGLGPSPALAADPAVRVLAESPLARAASGGTYGLIDLSADFLDQSEANATAFSREAIATYLGALAPDGMVSIPVSIREFPTYALRMLATVRAGLQLAGVADPGLHVAAIRSAWNVRILVARRPFDAARIATLKSFADARSFDLSWYPGIDVAAARDGLYNDLPAIAFESGEVEAGGGPTDAIADEAQAMLDGQPSASSASFDLRPITLDRPFYYAILRTAHLGTLLRRLEMLPQPEIGQLVNLAVLAQAVVIALLVLAVPLVARRRLAGSRGAAAGAGGWLRPVVYFSALGLGFLFIEIYLIEKASFALNDRSLAFALVLTGMLICSGLGSMAADRVRGGLWPVSVVVLVWCAACLVLLQPLLVASLVLPVWLRAGLILAVLAPVSFALGLPFPLGLSRAGALGSGFLPWAWGLNGAMSVVATPLANLVAVSFGYDRVLLAATVLYCVAHAAFPSERKSLSWQDNPIT